MTWILDILRPFARATVAKVAQITWNTLEYGAGLRWTNDPTNQRAVLDVDPTWLSAFLPPRYVMGDLGTAVNTADASVWFNDTAASVVVSNLKLVPRADILTDPTDHWTLTLNIGGGALATIDTSTTALVTGTPVSWGVTVTVPANGSLLMKRTVHGSPPALPIATQGRLP